jgi:hypothetical protein
MSTSKQELKKHTIIFCFTGISLLLLVIFFIFQYHNSNLLQLEPKWLILAGVPVLIGLFIGGYIKSFKGLGLELESNLKEPIPLKLISPIDVIESKGIDKESLGRLHSLSEKEKDNINRLRFMYGIRGYYDPHIILEHYRQLKRLQFVEIIDKEGRFLFLYPFVRTVQADQDAKIKEVNEFIESIENKSIGKQDFEVVTDYLTTEDNLLTAYRKIKKSLQSGRLFPGRAVLPILNKEKQMIGVVDVSDLEKKIAQEVEKSLV